jgi:hypothetical protein
VGVGVGVTVGNGGYICTHPTFCVSEKAL